MNETTSGRRVALLNALEELDSLLRRLSGLVQQRAREIWVWEPDDGPAPDKVDLTPERWRKRSLDRVGEMLRAIEYLDDQDPGGTRMLPGLVSVPADGLMLAHEVNEAKRAVGHAWAELAGGKISVRDPLTGEEHEVELRRHVLEACGRARHHHRQAIRELVVFDWPLESVGFTWTVARAITRITAAELRAEMDETRTNGWPVSELDYEALLTLPADEPLARIRAPHLQPRVNVAWRDEEGRVRRKVVRGSMPLFVPGDRLPRFRPLTARPAAPAPRLTRSDVTIESEPFMPSMKVYRYLDPVAARGKSRSANSSPGS